MFRVKHVNSHFPKLSLSESFYLRLSLVQITFRIKYNAWVITLRLYIFVLGVKHQAKPVCTQCYTVQDHYQVEIYIAFDQFWSELSSDFKSINAILIPDGNNFPNGPLRWVLPFAMRFWGFAFLLQEMQDTIRCPIVSVCVVATRLAQLQYATNKYQIACAEAQAPLNYSLSGSVWFRGL